MKYVFIDEILSDIVCWYFFGKNRTFQQLWKTKHFQNFNYFIVEKLFLQQKVDLVKNIYTTIPSWVSSDIERFK